MGKLLTQERFTVLASSAVAIAILGAAVTAQPSRTTPGDRLERLESDLRYQLELDAKVNPPVYAARTKTLDGVLDAWRQSSQSGGDYQVLQAWLRRALSQSLPGTTGEWPAAPAFSAVERSEGETTKEVAVAKPAIDAPNQPRSASPAKGMSSKSQAAKVKPAEPKQASRATAPTTRHQLADAKTDENAASEKPFIVHISEPVPIGSEALTIENPATPERSVLSSHEAPMVDGPADASKMPAPSAVEAAAVYNQSPSEPPLAKPQAAQPRVDVNLAELNARVGGYHDGLREVEAAVVAGREGITTSQVAKLITRLESLAGQYEFVQLYYGSLTPDERAFVLEPRSMEGTIELVDQLRSRVEAANEEDHFSTASGSEETELSRRVQTLLKAIE